MKGSKLFVAQLEAEGVDVVFGIPGIHLMHVLDALHDSSIRFVTTRHEQATTYMADGYSRVTGKPGVAMVVPGGGGYNALSRPRHGVGVLVARVPRRRADRAPRPRPRPRADPRDPRPARGRAADHQVGRAARARRRPGRGRGRRAFATMADGRTRPVEIEVAPDLFAAAATGSVAGAGRPDSHEPDPDAGRAGRRPAGAAPAPLLVVGGGVVLADASGELTAVAERLQAAVVNTREGKGGIDERHPLFVGTAWVNRRLRPLIDAADVVLAVGTRGQGLNLLPGADRRPPRRRPDRVRQARLAGRRPRGRRPARSRAAARRARRARVSTPGPRGDDLAGDEGRHRRRPGRGRPAGGPS